MAQSSQVRDEFQEYQNRGPESKKSEDANLKLEIFKLFDKALGSEGVDSQPGLLSKVFDYIKLDDNTKKDLEEFCDSYIDIEEKFPDIQTEEWRRQLRLSKNKSIFNDQGGFQKWALELMPSVWKEKKDDLRAQALLKDLKKLIFERAYNEFHDVNGNYLIWIREFFGKRPGSSHYRIDEAVRQFGKASVSEYLAGALISVSCKELKEQKNKKFITIIASLIQIQLDTNSAFLEEYHKILRSRFKLMLVKGEEDWNEFIELAEEAVSRLPYANCAKFISLLNLANSIAKLFDESSIIKEYGIRELIYLVKEFNKRQLNYPDRDFSDLDNKASEVAQHVSVDLVGKDKDGQFRRYQLYYPRIINSLLEEIKSKLPEIKDGSFLEACKNCAKVFNKEGNKLITNLRIIADKGVSESAEEEKVEFLIKRLENLRFIIESSDKETSPIRTEIVRTYLPFPKNFPQSIRVYFKYSISMLENWQEESKGASSSLLFLRFANEIENSSSKIKKWHFKSISDKARCFNDDYLKARSDENRISLSKMFEQEMKSDLDVFKYIYKDSDRAISESEKKYEVRENADEIYRLYKNISSIAFKQINARSNATFVKDQYSTLMKNIVDVFGGRDVTTVIKRQLEIINDVMKYLDSRQVQLNYPYHKYLLDEITAPYLDIKSILTLECLRKAASELVAGREDIIKGIERVIQSNQATDQEFVSELYSVFLELSYLYQQIKGKRDLFSSAGYFVYLDAAVIFGQQLLGQNDGELNLTTLNTILKDVNELIEFSQFRREEKPAFPFAALDRLEKSASTIPYQVGEVALCASIGCLIGLTILAAGYCFSHMTFGASVILSKEIGVAIMGAGAGIAGICGYALVSSGPSGMAASLSDFLVQVRSQSQNDLLPKEAKEQKASVSPSSV